MQPKETLTMAAAQLAVLVPDQWREFMQALSGLQAHMTGQLVVSQLDELQRNQGRVQAMASLNDLLVSCLTNAEKIKGKAK